MKRRPFAFLVCVFLVAAAAFTWTKLSAARRANSAAMTLAKRRTNLERCEREIELGLALSARNIAKAKADAPAAVPLSNGSGSPKVRPDASTLMAQHPELRALFERYSHSSLGLRYRPFYRAARLTPEQIVNFQTLVIEQRQEQMDLESATSSLGLAAPKATELRAEQEQRHNADRLELLGDEAFTAYREFQRIEPMEGIVASIPIFSLDAAEPLTMGKAELILDVLAKANSSYQSGGKADGEITNWPQVHAQLQGILSPAQAKALQGRAALSQVFDLVKQYQTQHEQPGH